MLNFVVARFTVVLKLRTCHHSNEIAGYIIESLYE